MKVFGIRLAVVALFVSGIISFPSTANAGTGLNQFVWGDANYTISKTSNKNSNVTGFWQALLASNGCIDYVDGIFGDETHDLTVGIEGEMGLPGAMQDGKVDAWTWNSAWNWRTAPAPGGSLRRQFQGSYAGFSFYGYYGGGTIGANFAWHPSSAQWYFQPYENQGTWLAATSSRTMGSYSYCG